MLQCTAVQNIKQLRERKESRIDLSAHVSVLEKPKCKTFTQNTRDNSTCSHTLCLPLVQLPFDIAVS